MRWLGKLLLCGILAAALLGCERRKTTTDVEVKDRLLGGKKVEETQVIEQGDKVQIREIETKTDSDGDVEEREVEVKGDPID